MQKEVARRHSSVRFFKGLQNIQETVLGSHDNTDNGSNTTIQTDAQSSKLVAIQHLVYITPPKAM